MTKKDILKIVYEVYPQIAKDYKSNPKVELHKNIYARLSGISEMSGEANPHAEYDWCTNKIYLYTPKMKSEEQIIRSLIHECVHSTQSKVLFDTYYEAGEDYSTHPFEIEARNAEENWEKYKLNTNIIG